MVNYILADYKRVVSRIPRIVFVLLYQAVFIIYVLIKWNKAAGNFNSVALLESANYFFGVWFSGILCTVTFIHSFSFDFSAKTVQVALGIGITRFQVILSKLIQTAMVMFTDFLITFGVFGILCAITGNTMAGHQIMHAIYTGMGSILLAILCVCMLLPLVFRTQNMVIALIGYFVLVLRTISATLRFISRIGPVFLARLQLDRYSFDSCTEQIQTNAITGNFRLVPCICVVIWFALGIYLTWVTFRKMELDF